MTTNREYLEKNLNSGLDSWVGLSFKYQNESPDMVILTLRGPIPISVFKDKAFLELLKAELNIVYATNEARSFIYNYIPVHIGSRMNTPYFEDTRYIPLELNSKWRYVDAMDAAGFLIDWEAIKAEYKDLECLVESIKELTGNQDVKYFDIKEMK